MIMASEFQKMSILPLFLLVGVALSRHVAYYEDTSALQPIVTKSQEHRMCAELCMSGLGGAACGDDCVDLIPQGLPLQSLHGNATAGFGVGTRQTSCGVLCENNLGYPLCACDENAKKRSKADFVSICSHFCLRYDHRIYGCQNCSIYKDSSLFDPVSARLVTDDQEQPVVNWDLWCQKMCQDGDGGAACNCDLLPMSLQF